MSDRQTKIRAFLAGTKWAAAQMDPLAGDASARRYFRLSQHGQTAILMDADPKAGQSVDRFITVGAWLRKNGFKAPEIYENDTKAGLLILEDFGPTDMAQRIKAHSADETQLYASATDILIKLARTDPLPNAAAITPKVAGDMLNLTLDWYADAGDQRDLINIISQHQSLLCPAPSVLALRDYHAENLMWLGGNQLGLLDFQDAILAPPGYDLVSLLRDIRRTVAPDLRDSMIQRYEAALGPCPDGSLAYLAVQRNLRILGVFARLAKRDGKRQYTQLIPRVWEMIMEDIRHPKLKDLCIVVSETLPPPTRSAIKDLL